MSPLCHCAPPLAYGMGTQSTKQTCMWLLLLDLSKICSVLNVVLRQEHPWCICSCGRLGLLKANLKEIQIDNEKQTRGSLLHRQMRALKQEEPDRPSHEVGTALGFVFEADSAFLLLSSARSERVFKVFTAVTRGT